MKKSIDLMKGKRFKKILLSNDLEDFEDKQNNENTGLTHLYTLDNTSNKRNITAENCEVYSSTIRNYKIPKENISENEIERKPVIKNLKNTWIKNSKNSKDKIKNEIKKKVYIKKKKIEKANKSEGKNDIQSPKNEDNDSEQREIIKELKDSVICYICLMKITSPRICPNCHKIACEKCLKNWFIDKGNNCCGYCRAILSFDKMISVPIINNVANLIDKISKKSNKKLGTKYTKSKIVKKNFKSISDISNEININKITEIINNDNINRNSINIDNFSKFQNKNNEIYIDKKQPLVSQSTHGPFINLIEKEYRIQKEYCPKHSDQPLYYFCLNCDQAYCRTCFVFFGEEKDKHNNHTIIEYEKYKSINFSKIKKISNNLDDKYEELDAYIKRCEALKNCYEFERKLVQKHVKQLMDDFNIKINNNIQILDDIIKKYNFYLSQIEKGQKDIEKFYTKVSSSQLKIDEEDLIEKLTNLCKIKYSNSKEIDAYSDINKKIILNFFQTKLKKYEIKQNNYHFKIPLEDSKYQLAITQKGSEVQIYIYWPIDKEKEENINKQEKEKTNLIPFIFIRRKNRNWEHFQLDEFLTYKGNNYYIKRFPVNNFCNINSYFKIKGLLYESYIQ